MAGSQVAVRQCHIPLNHVEGAVAEDALQAECVAAVDQVDARERVSQLMWAAAPGDACPSLSSGAVQSKSPSGPTM